MRLAECPLWVKSVIRSALTDVRFTPESGHQWDTRGKKPNDPVEGFSVPLFCKLLIRLRWRSPLGTATPCLNFQAVSVELSDRTAMSAFGAKAGQWLISDLCQSDEFFGRCGRKSEKFEIRGDLLE